MQFIALRIPSRQEHLNIEVLICNITQCVIGNLFLGSPSETQTCTHVTRVEGGGGFTANVSLSAGLCYNLQQVSGI